MIPARSGTTRCRELTDLSANRSNDAITCQNFRWVNQPERSLVQVAFLPFASKQSKTARTARTAKIAENSKTTRNKEQETTKNVKTAKRPYKTV